MPVERITGRPSAPTTSSIGRFVTSPEEILIRRTPRRFRKWALSGSNGVDMNSIPRAAQWRREHLVIGGRQLEARPASRTGSARRPSAPLLVLGGGRGPGDEPVHHEGLELHRVGPGRDRHVDQRAGERQVAVVIHAGLRDHERLIHLTHLTPACSTCERSICSASTSGISEILTAIGEGAPVTQRALAQQLGVALGLANLCLKRLAGKGLIKIVEFPKQAGGPQAAALRPHPQGPDREEPALLRVHGLLAAALPSDARQPAGDHGALPPGRHEALRALRGGGGGRARVPHACASSASSRSASSTGRRAASSSGSRCAPWPTSVPTRWTG